MTFVCSIPWNSKLCYYQLPSFLSEIFNPNIFLQQFFFALFTFLVEVSTLTYGSLWYKKALKNHQTSHRNQNGLLSKRYWCSWSFSVYSQVMNLDILCSIAPKSPTLLQHRYTNQVDLPLMPRQIVYVSWECNLVWSSRAFREITATKHMRICFHPWQVYLFYMLKNPITLSFVLSHWHLSLLFVLQWIF